jgi:hypothetical protein
MAPGAVGAGGDALYCDGRYVGVVIHPGGLGVGYTGGTPAPSGGWVFPSPSPRSDGD